MSEFLHTDKFLTFSFNKPKYYSFPYKIQKFPVTLETQLNSNRAQLERSVVCLKSHEASLCNLFRGSETDRMLLSFEKTMADRIEQKLVALF